MSEDPSAVRRRTQILRAHGQSKDQVWDELLEDLQGVSQDRRPSSASSRPGSTAYIDSSRPGSTAFLVTPGDNADDLDELMASLETTYTPDAHGSVRYSQPPVQSRDSSRFSQPPVQSRDSARFSQVMNILNGGPDPYRQSYRATGSQPNSIRSTRPNSAVLFGGDDILDDIIGNIGKELNSDSLAGASKGICESCRKPIYNQVISALGRTFHPEHFNCTSCGCSLVTKDFYTTQEHKPLCLKCHTERSGLLCSHCNQAIVEGQAIEALGHVWHLNHFVCTNCNLPFPGGNYLAKDNMPYCEQCYYTVYMPRCKKCLQPIRGDCVNAINSQWHPEHFNCHTCNRPLAGGVFFEVRGMPFCELHSNG